MKEALRYAAAALGELRTSLLAPPQYFELYLKVVDELSPLDAFFAAEPAKGRPLADLYELVQHPVRGLFLRAYLLQCVRAALPDGDQAATRNAADFLLANFVESNKLWVRMQHQGSARDRARRETERSQLADLVGKNLTLLSRLDGLDGALYEAHVLPRVLEQVVGCRDGLAQAYLAQCVVQAFPDEFHVSKRGDGGVGEWGVVEVRGRPWRSRPTTAARRAPRPLRAPPPTPRPTADSFPSTHSLPLFLGAHAADAAGVAGRPAARSTCAIGVCRPAGQAGAVCRQRGGGCSPSTGARHL